MEIAFDNLSTHYLLVSRNTRNIINSGYYRNVNWKIFIDTYKLGNNKIDPSSLSHIYDI